MGIADIGEEAIGESFLERSTTWVSLKRKSWESGTLSSSSVRSEDMSLPQKLWCG